METVRQDVGLSPAIGMARGVAALAVVMYHAYIWILAPWGPSVFESGANDFWAHAHDLTGDGWSLLLYPILGIGFLGVNLFFIISGFCIHLPHARKNLADLPLKKFFLRRLTRIYPLYVVMFTLLFLVYGPITHQYTEKGVNFYNIFGHVFFWHYFGPAAAAGMGISLVMWTLSLEIEFYLIYGFLFRWLKRHGLGRIAIAWCILDLAYHLLWHLLPPELALPQVMSPARFAPIRFGEWLLGAWIAELYLAKRLPEMPGMMVAVGIATIAVSVAGGGLLHADKYAATDVEGCVGFALILIGVMQFERRGQISPNRLLLWLGDRSYSIYLCHASIVLPVSKLAGHHLFHSGLKHVIYPSVFFGIAILAALAFSEVAYRLVEKPSHALARSIR